MLNLMFQIFLSDENFAHIVKHCKGNYADALNYIILQQTVIEGIANWKL